MRCGHGHLRSGARPGTGDGAKTLLQFAMEIQFDMRTAVFVDDCFCVEPESAIWSAVASSGALSRRLGLSVARETEIRPLSLFELPGDRGAILGDNS